MKRILFLCTGNTCRSPMAQAFLSEIAHKAGLKIAVRSAGLSTIDGLPVSQQSINALKQRGIQHQGASLAMNEEAMQWADLILTMTTGHKREVLRRYPDAVDKVYTLKEFSNVNTEYEQQLQELEELYAELQMQHLLGKPIDEPKRLRLIKLESQLPQVNLDVADPFGGSQSVYDECADELREEIVKLVNKLVLLRKQQASDEG